MKFLITKAFLAMMTFGLSSSVQTFSGDDESFWRALIEQDIDSMAMPTSKPTNKPSIEEVSSPTTSPTNPKTSPPTSDDSCVSIEKTICSVPEFATLCQLIDLTGLRDALNADIFTIFIPTDEAFNRLPSEVLLSDDFDFLRDILLYHTIPEVQLLAKDLVCGANVMMGNQEYTTTVCTGDVIYQVGTGNDADALPQIIGQNAKACNGILHAVDQVLLPDLASSNATSYPSDAPTDPVFDSTPTLSPTPESTDSDPTLSPTAEPSYSETTFPPHPLPTAEPSDSETTFSPHPLPTAEPSDSATTLSPTAEPSDSETTFSPDSVPTATPADSCQPIVQVICDLPEFEILCSLVKDAGLAHALQSNDDDHKVTLFAPINSAFTSLPLELANAVTSDKDFLVTILHSHIVLEEVLSSSLECNEKVIMFAGDETTTICAGGKIFQRGDGNTIDSLPEIVAPDGVACNGVVHAIDNVILPGIFETTLDPTSKPTDPAPTQAPFTSAPTSAPTSGAPTTAHSDSPPTSSPSSGPTVPVPTQEPFTSAPTSAPTFAPTDSAPTMSPPTGPAPTQEPFTSAPTPAPTPAPSDSPPTSSPSSGPTVPVPTQEPSTSAPTSALTSAPSDSPPTTSSPTGPAPTGTPTDSCQSIAEVICDLPEFESLCTLLGLAALLEALDGDNKLTVFAPVNDAFLAASLDTVVADSELLSNLLLSHVVVGEVFSSSLECSGNIAMLSGEETATICVDGKVFQRGDGNNIDSLPEIVAADGAACNGVVHAIDNVILPSTLAGVPETFNNVRNTLSEFLIYGGSELEDSDSYQSRALRRIATYGAVDSFTKEQIVQYYVLYCIYFATNGAPSVTGVTKEDTPFWENEEGWDDEDVEPCAGWYGIVCDEDGRIQNFDMPANEMTGVFPPEIALLSFDGQYATGAGKIERIDLTGNHMLSNGGDSSWVSNLGSSIRTLSFERTSFSGPLPRLPDSLEDFDISASLFTGRVEDSKFEGLEFLNFVDLDGNMFSGTVPSVFGRLPNLDFLYLSGNDFTGDLRFMEGMPSIRELWIDYNSELMGPLFDYIGTLNTLESFSVIGSNLSGPIPESFGDLQNMQQMWLQSNQLTGSIPTSLANLSSMHTLRVEGNMLMGSMPDAICANGPTVLGSDCHDGHIECACCSCCGVQACFDSEGNRRLSN